MWRKSGLTTVINHWQTLNTYNCSMSLHSDTLYWLRANQSLLWLLISACLVEKSIFMFNISMFKILQFYDITYTCLLIPKHAWFVFSGKYWYFKESNQTIMALEGTRRNACTTYDCWIYNYLCNQCLSPPMLWVRILIRTRCTPLCDKVCQWLATGRYFHVKLTGKWYLISVALFPRG
jgi:hypothetical protein